VYGWSSARFIYNVYNTTYANDLFHVDEQSGLFYTNSPYVQDVTYIGKGIRNFPTHLYLITLDGSTDDCNIMFRAEIGRNFSTTSPGKHYCSASSSYKPYTLNITSVNNYVGDSPNPKYTVPPSVILHYCMLGINIDNYKSITPTKDAFACLDELTSSTPGTHLGRINIGQDTKNFFDMSIYSPSVISLANAVNNFAQIMNSIANGVKDGSNTALNKLDDIRNNLVPEDAGKVNKKLSLVISILMDTIVLIFLLAATDMVGAVLFEGAISTGAILVERESIAFSRNFLKFSLSVYDFAAHESEEYKAKPENYTTDPSKWADLANQSVGNSTTLIKENRQNDSYVELNKALIYQSRIPAELFSQQPFNQLASDIQDLIDYLQGLYFLSVNANGSILPTMRTTAATIDQSNVGEITSGARFSPLATRGPWRELERGMMNDTGTAINRKRDLVNLPLGASVDLLETLSIDAVLNDFRKNLNQSAIHIDDFKNQVSNIISSINTEFKNSIAANLDGRDMLVLNNFLTPQIGITEDNGRSVIAGLVNDYVTAYTISTIMTAYGAVICSNDDVRQQCDEHQCHCNTPIGNDKCTIAGGIGEFDDTYYVGYKDKQLNLIQQWRNVSDICQNKNGWQFAYDTCEGYYIKVPRPGSGGSHGGNRNKRSTKYLICSATIEE
ncbi:5537_t:CDS:1, partial [Cetraspora pellucida]